jgi:hypothetical protein
MAKEHLSWRRWSSIGTIEPPHLSTLRSISSNAEEFVPAACQLADGSFHPCVVFIELNMAKSFSYFPWSRYFRPASPFRRRSFYRHSEDEMIDIREVERVEPSPNLLPIGIQKKMAEHGPNHMIGYAVRFIFKDGTGFLHGSTEFYWFASAPEGHIVNDIVDVDFDPWGSPDNWDIPGKKMKPARNAPTFRVCLYSSGSKTTAAEGTKS